MNHLKVIINQLCFCILLRNFLVTYFFSIFRDFKQLKIHPKENQNSKTRTVHLHPIQKEYENYLFLWDSSQCFHFLPTYINYFYSGCDKNIFPFVHRFTQLIFSPRRSSMLLLNQKYPYIHACFFTYLELVTQFQFQEISFLRNIPISREIVQID